MDVEKSALVELDADISCIASRTERLEEFLQILTSGREKFLRYVAKTQQDISEQARQLQLLIENDKNKLIGDLLRKAATVQKDYEKSRDEIERSLSQMKEFQVTLLSAKERLEESGGKNKDLLVDGSELVALHRKRSELDAIRHKIVLCAVDFKPRNQDAALQAVKNGGGNSLGSLVFRGKIDQLDRYLASPKLLQTIPGTVSILGLTALNSELFVLRCACVAAAAHIQVYSISALNGSVAFSESRSLSVSQLRDPKDITAGKDVLYLSDFCGYIFVLSSEGLLLSVWEVDEGPRGLSLTDSGHLLVTCSKTRSMKKYDKDGVCVSTVTFQHDIINPLHTVQLLNDRYAVCHGWTDNKQHRVCVVDPVGRLIHAYGGLKGGGPGHLDLPFRLVVDVSRNVLVIDRNNYRIQQLSSTMMHVRDVVSRERDGLAAPRRFMLDKTTGILYIGLNDGRVMIYKIMN